MRIAMLGTRGVPASYSGFETCVEQLGSRLVRQGHDVTVYCRTHHIKYRGKRYRGMRLVRLPTIRNKYLDTLVHTFISSLHALTRSYDICVYFIVGNSPVAWIPRVAGKRTILNVDGLDWKRDKWPAPAKRYLQLCERLAALLPNEMITDSREVQRYYNSSYHILAPYIPYGSQIERVAPGPTLKRFGLAPHKYILFVGRLVPENCVDHLVDAFGQLADDHGMKCVVVGGSAYADDYIAALHATAPKDVVFTGYLFGEGYRELQSNAYCFVETSGVGGTHPALVEAMGVGNCVIANDTPENCETIGDAGLTYSGVRGSQSLAGVLQRVLDDPLLVNGYGEQAARRTAEHFSWDAVTSQYLGLFYDQLAD